MKSLGTPKGFHEVQNEGRERCGARRSRNLDGKPTGATSPNRACDPEQ